MFNMFEKSEDSISRNTCREPIVGNIPTSNLNKEIKEAIDKVSRCIRENNFDEAKKILYKNSAYEDVILESREVINACKNNLAECLNNGDLKGAKIISLFMITQGIPRKKINEILNSEEIYNAKKEGLLKSLINRPICDIKYVLPIIKQGITREKLTEIIYDACKEALIIELKDGISFFEKALTLMKNQNISQEKFYKILKSDEIVNVCKEGLKKRISIGHINLVKDILSFMEEIDIPQEKFNEILFDTCKYGLIKNLSENSMFRIGDILSFIEEQNMPQEKIKEILNPNVIFSACKDGLIRSLNEGSISATSYFTTFMKEHGVSQEKIDEMKNSNEILLAYNNGLVKGLVKIISEGSHLIISSTKEFLSLMVKHGISKEKINEIVNSNEIYNAWKKGLTDYIFRRPSLNIKGILSFMEELSIPQEKITEIINSDEILNACKNRLIRILSDGSLHMFNTDISSFMEELCIPQEKIDEIINSDEILNACKNGLIKDCKTYINFLSNPCPLEFMKKHCIPQEEIDKILNSDEVLKAYVNKLIYLLDKNSYGEIEDDEIKELLSYIKEHNISQEKFEESTINTFKENLFDALSGKCNYRYDYFLRLGEKLHISQEKIDEILNTEELLDAWKNCLINNISKGYLDSFIEIFNPMIKQNIPQEKIFKIMNSDEMFNAYMDGLVYRLSNGDDFYTWCMISFIRSQNTPQEKIDMTLNSNKMFNAYKYGLIEFLSSGNIINAKDILSFVEQGIPQEVIDEIINSDEIFNACYDGIMQCSKDADKTKAIISFMTEHGIKSKVDKIINAPAI